MKTWKEKAEFDKTARGLVRMFQENFVKYESQVDADVRAAAPRCASRPNRGLAPTDLKSVGPRQLPDLHGPACLEHGIPD